MPINEPLLQTCIVGTFICAIAATISFYLWNGNRSERYLLFWGMAWVTGSLRWAAHYPAESDPMLRVAEGVLIPIAMLLMVLGSYDLLSEKPWKRVHVVATTAAILLGYGAIALWLGLSIELGYGLFTVILVFNVWCMLTAYRRERLTGYVFAAVGFVWQFCFIGFGLFFHGRGIAANIVGPLVFNTALMLSVVIIAYQRHRRRLLESERTLRELYVRIGTFEEEERRGLHRELHDQMGSKLTALGLELELVADLLGRGSREAAERHLGSARHVTMEAIVAARNLMDELRPPGLDELGLVAALRSAAQSQAARLDLPIDVTGDDLAPRLSPVVESALFRIAQEAVINAVKHASPTRVTIRVEDEDGTVTLTVSDNGMGFDAATQGAAGHWGLINMRERARTIGATLDIESSAAAGTTVRVRLPRETA